MAKRKITVTVDEELVALVQELGAVNLSAVVNGALAAQVEHLARRRALEAMLVDWESQYGAVREEDKAWASAAFDETDGANLTGAA
jgi:hypothetical protein